MFFVIWYEIPIRMVIRILIFVMLTGGIFTAGAQQVNKLIITDNLSNASKFGYGKPKPAPPRDTFAIMPEKGTQVLVFVDLTPDPSLPEQYKLRFTVYKLSGDQPVWVDDRVMDQKRTSTWCLTAFNLFDTGNYQVVLSPSDDKGKILAHGDFKVIKQ
ncbi:MAG: hypothetical protein IT242_05975 [Bacteroidia bacterium]|nr:hypothetical protein [Bacteroidia bacterium]